MSETKGFERLFRFCKTTSDYEAAKTSGIINDDVFVIIIQEKVAKFQGETFNWAGGEGISEEEIVEIELATAGTLVSLDKRVRNQEKEINSKASAKELKELLVEIINNELVIAASFSDINKQIKNIQNKIK